MKELILSSIVVIGTAFIYLWRRYGTHDAKREKIQKELDNVVEEMEKMGKFEDGFNFAHYHKLHNRRVQLDERISRLSR